MSVLRFIDEKTLKNIRLNYHWKNMNANLILSFNYL